MGRWQNLEKSFFTEVAGPYDFPIVEPVYELPPVKKFIQFDYVRRFRADRHDRSCIGVHFFEDDYKFERAWTQPDRYAKELEQFAYIIGPDFSTYIDFPKSIQIYNHYRNRWLVRYWQVYYNITVVPTILYGLKDTYSWCFDGLPTHSIVAISNVGDCTSKEDKKNFLDGYNEMLKRLEPSKILFFTRNFMEVSGNVEYISWELHKGDQLNG